MCAIGLSCTRKEDDMFANTEDRLLNFIYALACCNVFMGGLWLLGIVP